MTQFYTPNQKSLEELLAAAATNATVLIPDLQRPYVWSPNRVVLLADSLFRGWPFGTLLLWEVRGADIENVPNRPFSRVIDRTDKRQDERTNKANLRDYLIVLDGQQRLQSLLLAFAGDNWAFQMYDKAWAEELEVDPPRGRGSSSRWSKGELALDMDQFFAEYQRMKPAGENAVREIDYRTVLTWAVFNAQDGVSPGAPPAGYRRPLPLVERAAPRYVRLSRLYELCERNRALPERVYREKVSELLAKDYGFSPERIGELQEGLGEFLKNLENVRQSSVSFLKLRGYNEDEDIPAYHDAIVNVFTRLNAAGRALTPEEITFAWIKSNWGGDQSDGERAISEFEALLKEFKNEGFAFKMDHVVAIISTVWAVLYNGGVLLEAKDLLQGSKIKPMAQAVGANWKVLRDSLAETATRIRETELIHNTHYRSLNSLALLFASRAILAAWRAGHGLKVLEADEFEKLERETFSTFALRWLLLTQWAGKWGQDADQSMKNYAAELSVTAKIVMAQRDWRSALDLLLAQQRQWLTPLRAAAVKAADVAVESRDRVSQYHTLLWVWHRLNAERSEHSRQTLIDQGKRAQPSLDVDHIVAVALWRRKASEAGVSLEDLERLDSGHDEDVNRIGNCTLLKKNFNISKSAESLGSFLGKIKEFREDATLLARWAAAFDIPQVMLTPESASLDEIRNAVVARDERVRKALAEFIAGDDGLSRLHEPA